VNKEEISEILSDVLSRGYESRGVECKGPGHLRDKKFFAKVVRSMIGMANRRDGGLVFVGVEDNHQVLKPVGLNSTDLQTWKYDHVADAIARYVDPNISFELEILDVGGMKIVALQIREFESIPILCRKSYDDILRAGACYVRSRRKPETVEIPSQEDMRDLLDLATEKGLRKYFSQSAAAGVIFPSANLVTDREAFEQQIGDLL